MGRIDGAVNAWRFKPVGSESYRTAEVTLGGVDTRDLNSQTLEARGAPGQDHRANAFSAQSACAGIAS